MNFKTYVLMEAKKEKDMTPQELKASKAAKAEREKMLAKGREAMGLPPRTWKKAQEDPEEGPESKWAKRIRRDVEAQEAKQPPTVPKFAALAAARPKKEKKEAANESKSSRKWQHKQARRKAEGSLGAPEGERRHRRGLRAPYPVQNPGTGSKAYRLANVKSQKAMRLSKKQNGRDVRYSKGGQEYKVDVGMEGER